MEKFNIIVIHGAWSTTTIFNYLLTMLQLDDRFVDRINAIHRFDYDTDQSGGLRSICNNARKFVDSLDNQHKCIIIGHSMGGLVALSLESHFKCAGVVTIASPLGGMKINKGVELFLYARAPVLRDIASYSSFIYGIHRATYTKNITVVAATEGFSPIGCEKSDGVVPVETQIEWLPYTATLSTIPANHHEVLLSPQLVDIVKHVVFC